jgi:hypothetical protein
MKLLKMMVFGSNCVDCELVLQGRENTAGESFCQMIHDGLLDGNVSMKMGDSEVYFTVDGVTFGFAVPKERVGAVSLLIENGNICLEPFNESNYTGFSLSRSFR